MGTAHFRDKAVWITGGGSGLGAAMALEFARQGADVAISGRRLDRLDAVVAQIEALGRRASAIQCDVTDDAAVARAAGHARDAFSSRLDVVVANAGFGVAGTIESLPIEAWQRQFATNVFGAVSTIRHSLPALRETGGRIGLVGSVMGMLTGPKNGPYASSKHALRAIGQTLAMELHGSGVSVSLLNPGFVSTEISQVDNKGEFHAEWTDKRPSKLMWTAEHAARVMVHAMWRRKRDFTFTAHGKVGAFVGRHAPGLLHFAATRFSGR
jgi:NAD(P)-dependent dehydrogenase (short-subunit alcohol dehydrogenase family)